MLQIQQHDAKAFISKASPYFWHAEFKNYIEVSAVGFGLGRVSAAGLYKLLYKSVALFAERKSGDGPVSSSPFCVIFCGDFCLGGDCELAA